MIRVRVGEEKVQLARAQLARDLGPLLIDLGLQVGVALGELVELDQVARSALELFPRFDELTVLRRFACELARTRRIVPDAGLGQEPVELLGAGALGRKVKDAPSAEGSGSRRLWG